MVCTGLLLDERRRRADRCSAHAEDGEFDLQGFDWVRTSTGSSVESVRMFALLTSVTADQVRAMCRRAFELDVRVVSAVELDNGCTTARTAWTSAWIDRSSSGSPRHQTASSPSGGS